MIPQNRRAYKIRDSKLLTEAEPEALFDRIAGWCHTWAVGHATAEECDTLGMSAAQRLAADRAISALGVTRTRYWWTGSGISSAVTRSGGSCAVT